MYTNSTCSVNSNVYQRGGALLQGSVYFRRMETRGIKNLDHYLDEASKGVGRKFTLVKLAEETGYSYTYLQKLRNGKKRYNADVLQNIATVLKCSPSDLIGDVKSPYDSLHARNGSIERPTIPVIGYIGPNMQIFDLDEKMKAECGAAIECPQGIDPASGQALYIVGKHAAPFSETFIAVYDEKFDGVPSEWLGRMCVIKIADGNHPNAGQTFVRIVAKGNRPGHFTLESITGNETKIEDAPIQWSAFLKGLIQKL